MAKINHVELESKENAISFDDCDSMTDYYHGYRLGQACTIQWIKDKGGDVLTVEVVNDDPKIPALKRVNAIAKTCGYKVKDDSCIREYRGYMNEITKVNHLEWTLRK